MSIVVHAPARTFNRDEYYKMAEAGVFGPRERVELIQGEIIRMSPQNSPHAGSVSKATMVLTRSFGDTYIVRVQLPLTLADDCEPEPDFALVSPEALEKSLQANRHPGWADLILEVADSSLAYDSCEKASLYACYAILDYWLLDVRARRLVVHRRPVDDPEQPFHYGYAEVTVFDAEACVAPLCLPDRVVQVADML